MNPTLKILFVDDTRGKTSTLADILALSGDEPVLAFYGNESLNKARQMPIDCVFQ
jgi:DNA-binding response OmpR family regulator